MGIQALGILTFGSSAAVRLSSIAPTKYLSNLPACGVQIYPHPSNAAPVYVGRADMEGSPLGPGLMGVIAKPASTTSGPFIPFEVKTTTNAIDLADIWVMGNSGDGVIVNYTTL